MKRTKVLAPNIPWACKNRLVASNSAYPGLCINDVQNWAYIPMSKICRYRAARRDNSGSCCRARRSCSEKPQIKAIGMWQRSSRRTQRCRCRPTSWGLPEPHDCEHKVSRAL